MSGVLLVAHGSRAQNARQAMSAVADMVRARLPGRTVEVAYLNFLQPGVRAGLDSLAEKGHRQIYVVPFFLFDGGHTQGDIPAQVAVFLAENPGVQATLCKALGADGRLAEIVADRVEGAGG